MIISDAYGFIFMHCRKTAGTSVKASLSESLGPKDLMIGGWREAVDGGAKFNRRFWLDLMVPEYAARMAWWALRQGRLPGPRELNALHKKRYSRRLGEMPEHATATAVRNAFPHEWRDYYKFCFVRNPYEQAVSSWLFHQEHVVGESYPFHLYLELGAAGEPHRLIPRPFSNWPIYTIDDKIAVDFVGRYERFTDQFSRVLWKHLGIPPTSVPTAKRRKERYDYREAYSDADRRLAAKIFEKELDTFGYTFGAA